MAWLREDLIYLAGIIDGEGCITICREKKLRKHCLTIRYWCVVNVVNTNKVLMDWLHNTFAGKVRSRRPDCIPLNWKTPYQWERVAQQAKELCVEVLPYLKLKKAQAQILITFADAMKKPFYRHYGVPKEEIEVRDRLCDTIQALNKKGRVIDAH